MAEERRVDPSDGEAYTFEELTKFYVKTFKKNAIKEYWENQCTPVKKKKGAGKAEAKAKPKSKAKAKAKKEAKGEAKAEGEEGEAKAEEADDKAEEAEAKEPKPKFEDMEASGLCVSGEALIDFLPATTSEGGSAYRGVPGGSPFNCCIAAQRLGLPVTFLGALSTDLFGEELYGHLSKEGVNMDMVVRVNRPSTLAFVCRTPGEGEKYAFFKENSADRALATGTVAKSMRSHRFKAVHMSLGAVTFEHGPCSQAFRTLFRIAGRQGALRSFDPNIRANMIREAPAKYAQRIERFLKGVDLAKTSEEDLQFLYGEDADVKAMAAKWLKSGPKLVVVTRGAKGAEAFVTREGEEGPVSVTVMPPGERPNTIDAEGKPVPVSDTVGAGDTFMGGLIAGCLGAEAPQASGTPLLPQLLSGEAWGDAAVERLRAVLTRAGVCAAINCSRAGCDPPSAAEAASAAEKLAA